MASKAIIKISSYLKVYDFENAYLKIRDYLKSIQKYDFFPIISSLIKIAILEKDFEYSFVLEQLSNLNKDDYKFDLDYYKIKIAECEKENNTEKLEYLMEILYQAKSIDMSIEDRYELYDLLEQLELKNKCDDDVDASYKGEIEFLDKIHEQLLDETGVILMEPISAERRKRIYNAVLSYPDLVAFSIGESDENDFKRIVIRYKSPLYKKIDISDMIRDANEAFNNNDFEKCININLELLKYGTPTSQVYGSLGMAYIKLGNFDKAIMYITISKLTSNNDALIKRYDRLIEAINSHDESFDINKEAEFLYSKKSGKKAVKEATQKACKNNQIEYSDFMAGLDYAKIQIDKRAISSIAEKEPDTFTVLVNIAKEALKCKEQKIPYIINVTQTVEVNGQTRIRFKSVLGKIYGTINGENYKPAAKMEINEFNNSDNFYGIETFDLLDLYVREYEMPIEEAATQLGLTEEETNIVRLIYAREYYKQGFFDKGDEFIKYVEKVKNKTKRMNSIIKEIKTNKKFYKNRTTNKNQRVLSLKLSPKK